MNFKTLLLGSAAAMIMAGGAQAADLTVAEPVDYVKVCDAFGAGFYYSPGTDTCIKVGGYVKFGTSVGNGFGFEGSDGDAHWGNFYTEASIQLTASSVTEYGNLTGWIDLRAKTGSSYEYANSYGDTAGHIDSAYIELGPLKAGHFTSAFDSLGGYTDFGAFRADQSTDHIQWTYALNGFGVILSVEDGSDRFNPYYPSYFDYADRASSSPDVVAALTYASGPFSGKLSGAYVNAGANEEIGPGVYDSKSGWAVQASLEIALDNWSKGDKFGIQGVYADDAPAYTGLQKYLGADAAFVTGNVYGGFVSYLHYWNPSLWSAAEVSYLHSDDVDSNVWQVSASTDWAVVKNLDLMLDGSYAKSDADYRGQDNQWAVNVWLKRSW